MITQFLPFDYGSKKRLTEKLAQYLGAGKFTFSEPVAGKCQQEIDFGLYLGSDMVTIADLVHAGQEEIQDIREYMRSLKHGGLNLSIKRLLDAALKPDKLNKERRFIPREELAILCNRQAVYHELQQHFDDRQALDYTQYICDSSTSARKIFAILVLINYVHFIPKFRHAAIVDDDLPFGGSEELKELWSRHSNEENPIHFFDYFEDAEIMREFYIKQWWVHVPFIGSTHDSDRPPHLLLEPESVIPWTFIGEKNMTGGFGTVQMVQIHKEHHSFRQHGKFALKTFGSLCEEDEKFFLREVRAHQKLSPSPRRVELCATFEIMTRNTFMLLFPWAEGGSLSDLLLQPKEELCGTSNVTQKTFVEWIATECRGLVEGLQTIHDTRLGRNHGDIREDDKEYFGVHGDIKPPNILYFSQEKECHPLGTLKLADFGLMRFGIGHATKDTAAAYAASQTYRSPEHDIGYVMSGKVDIWALGCVYSELLTWAILSPEACEDYCQARLQQPSYSGATQGRGQWREDNFFLKHLQARKAGKELPPPVLVSQSQSSYGSRNQSTRRSAISLMKKGYDHTRMAIFAPEDMSIEETPRLKTNVSQWIQELILATKGKEGQIFFTDFLGFIEKEMLHPYREERADCKRTLDFFRGLKKKSETLY